MIDNKEIREIEDLISANNVDGLNDYANKNPITATHLALFKDTPMAYNAFFSKIVSDICNSKSTYEAISKIYSLINQKIKFTNDHLIYAMKKNADDEILKGMLSNLSETETPTEMELLLTQTIQLNRGEFAKCLLEKGVKFGLENLNKNLKQLSKYYFLELTKNELKQLSKKELDEQTKKDLQELSVKIYVEELKLQKLPAPELQEKLEYLYQSFIENKSFNLIKVLVENGYQIDAFDIINIIKANEKNKEYTVGYQEDLGIIKSLINEAMSIKDMLNLKDKNGKDLYSVSETHDCKKDLLNKAIETGDLELCGLIIKKYNLIIEDKLETAMQEAFGLDFAHNLLLPNKNDNEKVCKIKLKKAFNEAVANNDQVLVNKVVELGFEITPLDIKKAYNENESIEFTKYLLGKAITKSEYIKSCMDDDMSLSEVEEVKEHEERSIESIIEKFITNVEEDSSGLEICKLLIEKYQPIQLDEIKSLMCEKFGKDWEQEVGSVQNTDETTIDGILTSEHSEINVEAGGENSLDIGNDLA